MTPQQIEAMKQALEALKNNKLTHLYCEDTWYSCPKHEDGCANEAEGDECNCGADDVNAQFDQAIIALEEALAQPEQEPVAWADLNALSEQINSVNCGTVYRLPSKEENRQPLYITPPQRTWVGLTGEEAMDVTRKEGHELLDFIYEYGTGSEGVEERIVAICKATEAKLKEKNT